MEHVENRWVFGEVGEFVEYRMATIVRKAVAGDANAVLVLTNDFATSFIVDENTFHVSFESLLNKSNACLLVAEMESRVVGYALAFFHHTFFANGRVAWIEEIMVHPDYRRTGIGKELMHNIETWATDQKCRLIALATRRASAFYEANEYEDSATYYRKLLARLCAA